MVKTLVRRVLALLIVLAVVVMGAIQTRANPTNWANVSDPEILDSSAGYENTATTPSKDSLCEGTNGIPFGGDPSWAPVSGRSNPIEPARAFVEAHGQVFYGPTNVGNGRGGVFVTHTDIDNNHWTHDINVFVTPDKDSRGLLGDGNFNTSEYATNEIAALEIEWENGGLPRFAWPAPDDRITVWGNHIWDCGHGSPDDFRTEIHPPVGWVVYRQTADADGLPENGRQNQAPWTWYQTDDRQGIGATLPATGLRNTPVHATVADTFFSSFGAIAIANLNGCNDQTAVADDTKDAACLGVGGTSWASPLTQQDYSFFIPAPPKDGNEPADAVLVWDAEDRCAEIPANPGNPAIGDVERDGLAVSGVSGYNIGTVTCNIPDAVHEVTENGQRGIRVTVQAAGVALPANFYIGYAKRWKVAWDHVRPAADRVKTYNVAFNELRVWDDAEECSNDGEWLMGIRVNENWAYPVRGSGDDGAAFWEDGAIDDNDCPAESGDPMIYGFGGLNFTTHVRPSQPINVWEWSFEHDPVANDVLPAINTNESGPGTYTRGIASGDPEGGHEIKYTVSDITPPVPGAGSLTIGTPQYGPNANTGGTATRISGSTPLELTGSDALALQFQYWLDGQAIAGTWNSDATAPLGVTFDAGAADGIYTIAYAPVSGAGIVGERQRISVQLDRTPPTLNVPADIVVNGTEAAGTVVTYEVTASDSLPGPVTTSCDIPSGSFFLIKKVTTVTCTATDAVGNSTTKSFTVEVVSPFGYIPDFVVLGEEWTRLGNHATVASGNVGAFRSSAGVPNTPGYELIVSADSTLAGGPQLAGESVELDSGVTAGDTFYVDTLALAPGVTHTPRQGYVPLFLGMPNVPSFGASGANARYAKPTTLAPGTYGNIVVTSKTVLTLSGGAYYFTSLDFSPGSQLRVSAPTVVHVTGQVRFRDDVIVGPTGSGGSARDLIIYVTGRDAQKGKTAVLADAHVQIAANIYAKNGTLRTGSDGSFTGAFLAMRVDIGPQATLTRDSAFDYPYP